MVFFEALTMSVACAESVRIAKSRNDMKAEKGEFRGGQAFNGSPGTLNTPRGVQE